MKRKILWMLVSWLIVVAFVLSSCGGAVPGEQEEEEEEEEPVGEQEEEEEEPVGEQEEEEEEEVPVAGAPQYGGTLNMSIAFEPRSWDPWDQYGNMVQLLCCYTNSLVGGGVEKYGPRGTNEFPFTLNEFIPDKYLVGQLAESWVVTTDPLGVRFKIRQGMMWAGNSYIGMEPREYTAYDAEFYLNRFQDSAQGPRRIPFMSKPGFEAVDKYTLQAHFDKFSGGWPVSFGYGWHTYHIPEEAVEAGASDWRNQVAIGPFILSDYVKGSHVSYVRNPNWWNKERTISGETYELPFIDELVFPIIMDVSTEIAALRTGKLDVAHGVGLMYKDTLTQTPGLVVQGYAGGSADYISFNFRNAPMNILNIRRALMIGTDLEAVTKTIHAEGDVHCVPFNAGLTTALYTPIEDLPPEAKELFTYDPAKAKQMIIDEGYPDGITLEVIYSAAGAGGRYSQEAALLEDMWKDIGVTLVLQPLEDALLAHKHDTGDFQDLILKGGGNAKPAGMDLQKERAWPWQLLYSDVWFNENFDKASAEIDGAKRDALLKEVAVYYISSVSRLPLGNPHFLACWWPWIKNYYGETESGVGSNRAPMYSSLWIDQTMKTDMGY